MKRCSMCGATKPLDDFMWHRREKGQRDCYCRPCRAAYKQRHYAANKQRYVDRALVNKQRMMRENLRNVVTYLRKHPCVDCGETDPLVLDFDHRRDKSFEISRKLRERTWPAIAREIEKCDVRCSNCHRRRTAHAAGHARLRAMQPCCEPGRKDDPARLLWTALRSSMRE